MVLLFVFLGGFSALASAIPAPPLSTAKPPLPNTKACPLGRAKHFGLVTQVRDGHTLKLADGGTVRLVGALPPHPPRRRFFSRRHGSPLSLAQRARRELARLARGRRLGLVQTGRKQDRYGRLLGQAVVQAGEKTWWLQYELVVRGLARVYSFADNRACIRLLLRAEEEARRARRGLWGTKRAFAVGRADQPGALYRHINHFAIIRGRVLKVGTTRKSIYLNFGENWRRDFTVMIAARHKRRFARAGVDLAGLAGQNIRVRGWLESWNGPLLRLTHPEQLEILTAPQGLPETTAALLPDLPRSENKVSKPEAGP